MTVGWAVSILCRRRCVSKSENHNMMFTNEEGVLCQRTGPQKYFKVSVLLTQFKSKFTYPINMPYV